jgi:ribosomal protein S17
MSDTTQSANATPEAAPTRPNARKVREGTVASTSMDKTIVVEVVEKAK